MPEGKGGPYRPLKLRRETPYPDDWPEGRVVDRAVHNSPPPMDDVGEDVSHMLDEKDPAKLPSEASARKAVPITTGVLDYFPLAIAEIARVSKRGNDQHNPGEPLHWAREKSTDHADCIARHLLERGWTDNDGQRHTAKLAWRALALLQEEMEAAAGPGKD
jgi:hypothetical protein